MDLQKGYFYFFTKEEVNEVSLSNAVKDGMKIVMKKRRDLFLEVGRTQVASKSAFDGRPTFTYRKFTDYSEWQLLADQLVILENKALHKKALSNKGIERDLLNIERGYIDHQLVINLKTNKPAIYDNPEGGMNKGWRNSEGYFVGCIDLDSAEPFVDNYNYMFRGLKQLIIDKNKNVFDMQFNHFYKLCGHGIDNIGINTMDIAKKHANPEECSEEGVPHNSNISNIYSTRKTKGLDTLKRDAFYGGLQHSDGDKSHILVAHKQGDDYIYNPYKGEKTKAFDYNRCKVIIDLDNTKRNHLVIKHLINSRIGPQLITVKNPNVSSNPGSACLVYFFDTPLTKDERKRFINIIHQYILKKLDTFTVDKNCSGIGYHQNPLACANLDTDNPKLTNTTYIKYEGKCIASLYKYDDLTNILKEYDLNEKEQGDNWLYDEKIAQNKDLKCSYMGYKELIKYIKNHPDEITVDKKSFKDFVPAGFRNTVLITEHLPNLMNEYALYKTPDYILSNKSICAQEIYSYADRLTKAYYDNTDGEITYKWLTRRVVSYFKLWVANYTNNRSKSLDCMYHCYNIMRNNKESMILTLDEIEYNENLFVYVDEVKRNHGVSVSNEIAKMKRERGNNTQKLLSFLSASLKIETLTAKGITLLFSDSYTKLSNASGRLPKEAIKSGIIKRTSFEQVDSLIDDDLFVTTSQINAKSKLIATACLYSQAVAAKRNSYRGVDMPFLHELNCFNSKKKESDKMNKEENKPNFNEDNTAVNVDTSKTVQEENTLLALNLMSVFAYSEKQREALYQYVIIKAVECICECVEEFSKHVKQDIAKANIDPKEYDYYKAVRLTKLQDKVVGRMLRKYNISVELFYAIFETCFEALPKDENNKEITDYNPFTTLLRVPSPTEMREKVDMKLRDGIGTLFIKHIIRCTDKQNLTEETYAKIYNSLNVYDDELFEEDSQYLEDTLYVTYYNLGLLLKEDEKAYNNKDWFEAIKRIDRKIRYIVDERINDCKKAFGFHDITKEEYDMMDCDSEVKRMLSKENEQIETYLESLRKTLFERLEIARSYAVNEFVCDDTTTNEDIEHYFFKNITPLYSAYKSMTSNIVTEEGGWKYFENEKEFDNYNNENEIAVDTINRAVNNNKQPIDESIANSESESIRVTL